MSNTFYAFEVGHVYGNWRCALKRRVVARTKCYVTFEGGYRRKIYIRHIDADTTTEAVASKHPDLRVFAAAEWECFAPADEGRD